MADRQSSDQRADLDADYEVYRVAGVEVQMTGTPDYPRDIGLTDEFWSALYSSHTEARRLSDADSA